MTKRAIRTKKSGGATTVAGYDARQAPVLAALCRALRREIDAAPPAALSRIWHGSPVWFVGETPVVGYNASARRDVQLLFWNGQAFEDPGLAPIGKFRAAEKRYTSAQEIELAPLRRWLRRAGRELWDLGDLRERRGEHARERRR